MLNILGRISIKDDVLRIGSYCLNIDFKILDGWMFSIGYYHFRTKLSHAHGNKYYVEVSWYQTRENQLKGENCINYIWVDYYKL